MLKWLREQDCPCDEDVCNLAALGGHLEVLQWARGLNCEWDVLTCELAAQGGHLEFLQWAREHGCDWDEATCVRAAEGGHLEAVAYTCPPFTSTPALFVEQGVFQGVFMVGVEGVFRR